MKHKRAQSEYSLSSASRTHICTLCIDPRTPHNGCSVPPAESLNTGADTTLHKTEPIR